MNEAFLELPEEKQQRVVNAALEVFALHEYKRASTDDIAAKAGISKGLLFYYFHNKKELYLYLFRFADRVMAQMLEQSNALDTSDFFELLERGAREKTKVVERNPYLMEFCVRAFYSAGEEISGDTNRLMKETVDSAFEQYFSGIDFSKFREGVDPAYVFQMLTWMTDGYLHERQRAGKPLRVDDIMGEYRKWAEMFRRMVYRDGI